MRLSYRQATIAVVATVAITSAGAALAATSHSVSARAASAIAGRPQTKTGGFRANSASFLSASTGYVLGGVNCKPGLSCPAKLASTTDGGVHWRLTSVRGVTLDATGQVLFVSPRIGWMYGSGELLATRDGGRHWQRRQPGMGVLAMALAGPRVYAVLTPLRHSKQPAGLYSSPVSHSSWSLVPGVTGSFAVLASQGDTLWYAATATPGGGQTSIWTRVADGRWHKQAFTCPGKFYGLSSIAAASRSQIAYLCTSTAEFDMSSEGVRVLVSADGGRTAHLVGRWVATVVGSGGVLAMAPGNTRVITFAAPANAIGAVGRSVNGGRTWRAFKALGIGTWNSLSFVSASTGFIVESFAGEGLTSRLLRTTNAGQTWKPVHLPQS